MSPGSRSVFSPVTEQRSLFPPAVELGSGKPAAPDPFLVIARRRVLWFSIVVLFWMGAVFVRQVHLQIVRRAFFEEKARMQQQRTVPVRAGRGLILDRRGRELAVSVPVDSICAMPAEITDPDSVAAILSPIVRVPRAELAKRFAGRRGFCWVQRLVEPEVADRVRALNLKGIYFHKESKRYYPKGKTAAHLVGAVGLDQIGLAGIEQSKEEDLQGRPGIMVVSADARQRQFAGKLSREPEPGLNIMLTVDERIQSVAEREVSRAVARTGAEAAAIVILEPATGAVLAMANHPAFDPNRPPRSASELEVRRNYAVSSAFEPGSTFKLLTISAALEEKVARPDEIVDCQMGSIVVAGLRIRDHKKFGQLTVEQVLSNSSDVGAIKLGMRLGDRRMYQYIRRFGFGRPTGIELPGEAEGLTKPAEEWSKVSIGAISMGQEVGVTAIQMAQAVAAIANTGVLVPPRVIQSTFEAGGQPSPAVPRPGRRALSPETAIQVKRMMEKVVLEGTGKLARLDGYTAGGKTGTAQKIDPRTGAYSKSHFVASFVGFAPLHNPAVAIAVILDSPRGLHSGGGVAAPIFARVATEVLRYLQVPQDVPVNPATRRPLAEPDATLLTEVSDFSPDNDWGSRTGAFGAKQNKPGPVLAIVVNPRFPAPDLQPSLNPGLAGAMGRMSVPDFYGQTMRAVAEQAAALGLEVELHGSGLARLQSPPPGAPLPIGARVMVEFER